MRVVTYVCDNCELPVKINKSVKLTGPCFNEKGFSLTMSLEDVFGKDYCVDCLNLWLKTARFE